MADPLMLASLSVLVMSVTVTPPPDKKHLKAFFNVTLKQEFKNSRETLDEVRQLILDKYYSRDIDEASLNWAAINGMLRHVTPPDRAAAASISLSAPTTGVDAKKGEDQVSIGVFGDLDSVSGSITVKSVVPGSPAVTVIQPGDRILQIDGKSLQKMRAREIDGFLKGPVGSEVKVTFERNQATRTVTIKRLPFKTSFVSAAVLPQGIGYIDIRRLTPGVSGEVKLHLEELRTKKIDRLVLDLRDNNSGVLGEALKVSELFLPAKAVVARLFTREKGFTNFLSTSASPSTVRVMILINHQTAGMAELISSALKEHGRSLLVGSPTGGEALLDETFVLKNGAKVKIPVAALLSPKGTTWQSQGLKPDFLVPQRARELAGLATLSPEDRLQRDVSLLTAYKLLLMK